MSPPTAMTVSGSCSRSRPARAPVQRQRRATATTTTTNTFTPLNQVATVSYSGSSAHSSSYGYDASGNRLTMSDATGSSTYGYDPFNELSSYENGAGSTVSYSYNDDGKTTGITYPLGAGATWATTDTVSYGYDNADDQNSPSA